MKSTDILICGAGIVGLTIARELVENGYTDITVLEKEHDIGRHASGRNSGVLHAGIYYTPKSTKAELCLKGNLLMQDYCQQKGLPLQRTGKVIVATSEEQVKPLEELYNRALLNKAKVDLIDLQQLADIEPNARSVGKAIYSHNTAVVDPHEILLSLKQDLVDTGTVEIIFNNRLVAVDKARNKVTTSRGSIEFKKFINAAGAYSDVIARQFHIDHDYKILPFKGIYRQLVKNKTSLVKGNIYPVPNINNPFLGVHFTRNIEGKVYIGPTAIPAFGRENYGILQGIDTEAGEIILTDIDLFFQNKKFRAIAFDEPKKYFFRYFFNDAKKLIKGLEKEDVEASTKIGIRPQLVNMRTKELVMDYVIKETENSVHILNAISPAFTSSMAFANMLVAHYIH